MDKKCNRRDFLKTTGFQGLGLTLGSIGLAGYAGGRVKAAAETTDAKPAVKPLVDIVGGPQIKIGFVGVGGMGSNHVKNLLKIPGVQLRAVCDIVPQKVARIQDWTEKAVQPKPAGYSRGETDFKRMCQTEDLDLVYTATPWRWHVPVCVEAMKTGKHAATEVPAAVTIEECWKLVETSEKTGKHCVMMENCCYDETELMILNMVCKGLLGEVLHGECGYLHDLREVKFSKWGEGLWRTEHSIKRNGNLYPTHGVGPIAQCMDINRGDKFDYMVSISSSSRGLQLYAAKHLDKNDPRAKQNYALGDINISVIKTFKGRTIIVKHDCNLPRPYSRDILLQGTKGVVRKYPEAKIHIEGISPAHAWEPLDKYEKEYQHPLWKAMKKLAEGAGHGGMDFIEDYRLIKCLRTGEPMDMDVYDAASWSAISELSEKSVARMGESVKFPDFTRGKWKTNKPLGIITS